MIHSKISLCYDGLGKHLSLDVLKYVVIHKTDLKLKTKANPHPMPDHLLDGPALCVRFSSSPKPHPDGLGTNGRPPYHFLIRADLDATCEQMIPLTVRGAHTRNYNWRSIGVAVVGDFEQTLIQPPQWNRLVEICSLLAPINGGLDFIGHSEAPAGSFDPLKRCPGKFLSVYSVEQQVAKSLPKGWQMWTKFDIETRMRNNGIEI